MCQIVEQELLTLPEDLSSPPVFGGIRITQSLVYVYGMFRRSLFVLLYFFFWPLRCLFFFDTRILITPGFGIFKLFSFGIGTREPKQTCDVE
jgi:hypothetical protein